MKQSSGCFRQKVTSVYKTASLNSPIIHKLQYASLFWREISEMNTVCVLQCHLVAFFCSRLHLREPINLLTNVETLTKSRPMTQNRRLSKTLLSGPWAKQRGIWDFCFDDVTYTWCVWRQHDTDSNRWQYMASRPKLHAHVVTYIQVKTSNLGHSLPSIGRQHSATGRRRRQHVLSKRSIHPQQNWTASQHKRQTSKCVLKLKPQILCQYLLWVGNSPTKTW
jgi:hypothetical protein